MSSLKPLNYHNKSFKTPHQTFTNIIQLLNTSFNKKKKEVKLHLSTRYSCSTETA